MEVTKTGQSSSKISGFLFLILSVSLISNVVNSINYKIFPLFTIIYLLGYATISFTLFTKRRDKVIVIAMAILTLSVIIGFFQGFNNGSYMSSVWHYKQPYEYKFNLMFMLPSLVNLVGFLGTVFVGVVSLTDYLQKYKEKVSKLWFVPATMIAASFLVALVVFIISGIGLISGDWINAYSWISPINILRRLLIATAFLFADMWMVYPDGMPKHAPVIKNSDGTVSDFVVPEEEGYCSLAKHVLLLLFTFGIWNLIWIYKTTNYLNRIKDEEYRNPTTKLLLCMFVPFYSIFWTYKSAQRIDKLAKEKNLQSDLSTLCLILAIFVPIIPPILMQDKINSVITSKSPINNDSESVKQSATQNQNSPIVSTNIDITEELKKYKELLDTGVITKEEFDGKKKQLLNL